MIIAAYAGTGKTTLARLYPQVAVDFVCMPYKYQLEQDGVSGEACKANPDNVMQDDWPYNYVAAIKLAFTCDKLLLVPTDLNVLALLRQEKLPYLLCYPQKHAKEVYRQHFLDRGNTAKFIEIFIGRWDWYLEAFEQDLYGKHIVLQPHQFLSDVIECQPRDKVFHNA